MIGLYVFGFLLGTFKFMFAAAFLLVAASEAEIPISYWEVVISTFLGAFVSFNVFFFFSGLLMERAKEKKLEKIKKGTLKPKKQFSRMNKFIVRLKFSSFGYFVLVIVGPMVLSIPIGSIIIAKFYRKIKFTYWLEVVSLFVWANLFTLVNLYIFGK
jgi:TRAP-type uncharacterized transport system fused permease subunit|tara:strand:+ start:229 stop:699 length:471 start_codon:yes stop_codon:yes gene_type:complete